METLKWVSGWVMLVALVIGVGALASCGLDGNSFSGGFKDLENIQPQDPTDVRLYNNVNGYPNIAILCTDGVAWATPTRDSLAAIQRVPELDPTCTGYRQR